jgi:hypothetical protein
MTRLPDWQSRLSEYLTRCAHTPFKYGSLDCGLFIAGAIEAVTGVDVALPLRGNYTTRTEAFAAIKALCGVPTMEAVAEYIARKHGIPEVPILCAQRGDAVVLKHCRNSTLGIIAMHGTEILTPYKDGILRLPLSLATRAYHIG